MNIMQAENAIVYAMLYMSADPGIRGAITALKCPFTEAVNTLVQKNYALGFHENGFQIGEMYQGLINDGFPPDKIMHSKNPGVNIKQIVEASLFLNNEYRVKEVHRIAERLRQREITAIDARDMLDSMLSGTVNDSDDIVNKYQAIDVMKLAQKRPDNVSYGFPSIDNYTGGIRRERMTIVASRPGIGKSDVALHIARKNLEQGRNVLIASIEMDRVEILSRLAIPVGKGFFASEEDEWLRKMDGLNHLKDKVKGNYYIFDRSNMTASDVLGLVTDDIDIVILDYMQIMAAERYHKSEYEKISELSNSLRAAAKETKAAWVVLSQLSRPSDKKNAEIQEPGLADLRGSGSLEQDAYAVMLMNLHEVRSNSSMQNVMLTIAKNRGGGTGKWLVTVDRPTHTWTEG